MTSLNAISLLTIFPDFTELVLKQSMLGRAQKQGVVSLESVDLRKFAQDKHRSVDDTVYGGKQGMLFMPEVLEKALEAELAAVNGKREHLRVLYPSPRGLQIDQGIMDAFASWIGAPAAAPDSDEGPRRISIICGRYEGIDERIIERWVDFEYSVGDFVLTGGEIPALLLVDGVTRLLPGVLGREASHREDSFQNGLLEHPQYTKPRDFKGQKVPDVLLSGVHKNIEEWKLRESLLMTFAFRPDLIRSHRGQSLPAWARELLASLKRRLDLREINET
jgi:tRNA (guanine37-N1)-methyltransferase